MKNEARILFVVSPDNDQAKIFAQTLRDSMTDWNIAVTSMHPARLLLEIRKADFAHFFLPSGRKPPGLIRSLGGGKTKIIQTIVSTAADLHDSIFGDVLVVFSRAEKALVEKHRGRPVHVIPPCAPTIDPSRLQPASVLRSKLETGDRLLVVALSDLHTRQDWDSFLYLAREYQRREIFRFIVPRRKTAKETLAWRARLAETIANEKLYSTTLLDDWSDEKSLLDAADFLIYPAHSPDAEFGIPLSVLQGVNTGKPVLCFDAPPVNEVLREFRREWICANTEDFIRESRDIAKDSMRLDELSTDLARFARARYSAEAVAAKYAELYAGLS